MKRKTIQLAGVKTAGLAEGEFIGYASTFGNIDSQGDRVMKGAFAKSIASDTVVPIAWEHLTSDPRNLVGEIKTARETDEGLEIHAVLDLDTEHGKAAYRAVKSRRVKSLSIGYGIRNAVKSAVDGARELTDLDLMEVSLVSRPANTEARITDSKAAGTAKLVKARAAVAKATDDAQAETDGPADDSEMTHGERMLAALEAATDAAKALIAAAEDDDRDLTDDEAAEVEKALRTVTFAKSEIADWNTADPEGRKGLQWIQDVGRGRIGDEEFHNRWSDSAAFTPIDLATKTTRQTKTKAEEATMTDQYIHIGGHGRKAAAAAIVGKMLGRDRVGTGGDTGTKALTTAGQIVTDIPVAPNAVPLGRPATSLLDVVPRTVQTSPTYAYIRQNARNLAAAAVAAGAVKPTSTVGSETITNTASVIAHLSEAVDKFVLSDSKALGRLMGDEMLYGLDLGIQNQILNGNGTAPNQRGVLNTSGISVQAFETSALVSLRRAMTKAEALGYVPSVAVLRPEDWEAVEIAAATTDAAVAFNGIPLNLAERKVWGLTVVLSTQLPAKTALVFDPAALTVDTVGGVDVEWARESGELFSRNQVQLRVECRIGVSVFRPESIYRVATAA